VVSSSSSQQQHYQKKVQPQQQQQQQVQRLQPRTISYNQEQKPIAVNVNVNRRRKSHRLPRITQAASPFEQMIAPTSYLHDELSKDAAYRISGLVI